MTESQFKGAAFTKKKGAKATAVVAGAVIVGLAGAPAVASASALDTKPTTVASSADKKTNADYEAAKQRLAAAKAQVAAADQALSVANHDFGETSAVAEEAKVALEEAKVVLSKAQEDYDVIFNTDDITFAKGELATVQSKLDVAQAELDSLQGDITFVGGQIEKIQVKITNLEIELESAEQRLENARTEAAKYDLPTLRDESAQADSTLAAAEARAAEMQGKIDAQQAVVDEQQAFVDEMIANAPDMDALQADLAEKREAYRYLNEDEASDLASERAVQLGNLATAKAEFEAADAAATAAFNAQNDAQWALEGKLDENGNRFVLENFKSAQVEVANAEGYLADAVAAKLTADSNVTSAELALAGATDENRDELTAALADAQEKAGWAQNLVDSRQGELEGAQAQLAELGALVDAVNAELAPFYSDLDQKVAEYLSASDFLNGKASAVASVEQAIADIDELGATRADRTAAAYAAYDAADDAVIAAKAYARTLEAAQAELGNFTDVLDALTAEFAGWPAEYEELKGIADAAKALYEKADEAINYVGTLERYIVQLNDELDAENEKLPELEKELEELRAKLPSITARVEELTATVDAIQDEIDRLVAEQEENLNPVQKRSFRAMLNFDSLLPGAVQKPETLRGKALAVANAVVVEKQEIVDGAQAVADDAESDQSAAGETLTAAELDAQAAAEELAAAQAAYDALGGDAGPKDDGDNGGENPGGDNGGEKPGDNGTDGGKKPSKDGTTGGISGGGKGGSTTATNTGVNTGNSINALPNTGGEFSGMLFGAGALLALAGGATVVASRRKKTA